MPSNQKRLNDKLVTNILCLTLYMGRKIYVRKMKALSGFFVVRAIRNVRVRLKLKIVFSKANNCFVGCSPPPIIQYYFASLEWVGEIDLLFIGFLTAY